MTAELAPLSATVDSQGNPLQDVPYSDAELAISEEAYDGEVLTQRLVTVIEHARLLATIASLQERLKEAEQYKESGWSLLDAARDSAAHHKKRGDACLDLAELAEAERGALAKRVREMEK